MSLTCVAAAAPLPLEMLLWSLPVQTKQRYKSVPTVLPLLALKTSVGCWRCYRTELPLCVKHWHQPDKIFLTRIKLVLQGYSHSNRIYFPLPECSEWSWGREHWSKVKLGSGLSAVGKWGEWTQHSTNQMDSDISTSQKRMKRLTKKSEWGKRNTQTVTQKNQGTKVDSESEPRNTFKDPLRNNWVNKKAQPGFRQQKRSVTDASPTSSTTNSGWRAKMCLYLIWLNSFHLLRFFSSCGCLCFCVVIIKWCKHDSVWFTLK